MKSALMWVGESWKKSAYWLTCFRWKWRQEAAAESWTPCHPPPPTPSIPPILPCLSIQHFFPAGWLNWLRYTQSQFLAVGEKCKKLAEFEVVCVVCNEVRVPSCQRLAVVRRAGKHTSCSWLPGLKATVTLVEEEEGGVEGGSRNSRKSRARRWMGGLEAQEGERGSWILYDRSVYSDYMFTLFGTLSQISSGAVVSAELIRKKQAVCKQFLSYLYMLNLRDTAALYHYAKLT